MKHIGRISVLLGMSILILWVLLLGSGQVPELTTAPWEIVFHIIAESLMAGGLIAAGLALQWGKPGKEIMFFPYGMLFYSGINSAGFYFQEKNVPMGIFLLLVSIFAVWAVAFMVTKGRSRDEAR